MKKNIEIGNGKVIKILEAANHTSEVIISGETYTLDDKNWIACYKKLPKQELLKSNPPGEHTVYLLLKRDKSISAGFYLTFNVYDVNLSSMLCGNKQLAFSFANVIMENSGAVDNNNIWAHIELDLLAALLSYVDLCKEIPTEKKTLRYVAELLRDNSIENIDAIFAGLSSDIKIIEKTMASFRTARNNVKEACREDLLIRLKRLVYAMTSFLDLYTNTYQWDYNHIVAWMPLPKNIDRIMITKD